jgi:CBS domain-containing protein
MFSQLVERVMALENLLTAGPDTSAAEAAQRMVSQQVGAMLVVDQGRLLGIFTERDALVKLIAQGRDPRATRLADVMTPAPMTVSPGTTYGHALSLMHKHRLRHLPVVADGKPVGIVSARDALDPEMEEFVSEARRREGLA